MKHRNISLLFDHGNTAQREKLERNNHKRPFSEATPEYCIKRIHEELIELEEAETPKEMRSEAADISNFCHMLIYACDKRE